MVWIQLAQWMDPCEVMNIGMNFRSPGKSGWGGGSLAVKWIFVYDKIFTMKLRDLQTKREISFT